MEKKHNEIENLIKDKLSQLEQNESSEAEKKKFGTLYKAFSNKQQTLFDKISIETARAILLELGVKEDEWFETYIELKEEEKNRKYTLIDIEMES